jgi:hypothetical protein
MRRHPLHPFAPATAIARHLLGLSLALVLLATASAAEGGSLRGRVGVAAFTGPGAAPIERLTGRLLAERRFRVVALDSGDSASLVTLRAAAKQLNLGAVLVGRVDRKGRKQSARIIARSGDSGEILAQATFSARSPRALARAVERGLWKRFGPALSRPRSPRDQAPLAKGSGGVSP